MPDSAWTILAITLAALAAATLLWAIFADLIRQRIIRRITKADPLRRCPKCWYDMRHTPGRTCSECGYTAKRERQLFKSRRSNRGIIFALVLFMASYACIATPRVIKRGWVGAVPTTGLVLVVPWMQVNESDLFYSRIKSRMPFETKPLPLSMVVPNELIYRIVDDALSDWQWAVLSRSALRNLESIGHRALPETNDRVGMNQYFLSVADERGPGLSPSLLERALKLPPFAIRTRAYWPINVPLQIEVINRRFLGNDLVESQLTSLSPGFESSIEYTIGAMNAKGCFIPNEGEPWQERQSLYELGVATTPVDRPRIEVSFRRLVDVEYGKRLGHRKLEWTDTVELPVSFVNSIDHVLQPVSNEKLNSIIRNDLDPFMHSTVSSSYGSNAHLHLDFSRWIEETADMENLTIAARFEVIHEGVVREWFRAWWDSNSEAWQSFRQKPGSGAGIPRVILSNEFGYGAAADLEPAGGKLELRIVSDPELALRNFDCDRYWEGDITIPLRWGDPEQY